jgi:dihydroorotate dehydrogenase
VENFLFKIIKIFPPEIAHNITLKFLKFNFKKNFILNDPILHQHMLGFDFNNPLGLAAGFDKNAEVVKSLLSLGFGFVEAGTITPKAQYGNNKPRIFRLKDDLAIINHLGFNNKGANYAEQQLKKLNLNPLSKGIVGINIGKNKLSSSPLDDYNYCLEKLGPLAHYVTINISSPNTPGLRNLQNREQIENLLKSLNKTKNKLSSLENTPIFFKIAPDLDDEQVRDIALISLANNIDGLIIGNTTLDRPNTLRSSYKNEIGGLSGKPLFLKSTLMLKKMYSLTNGQVLLFGVGGISSGLECYEKIKAGASLVQIYTALIYFGPNIINKILFDLVNLLKIDGYKNIKEAIGKDV